MRTLALLMMILLTGCACLSDKGCKIEVPCNTGVCRTSN